MTSEYYKLEEKVFELEKSLKTLGDEMHEKVNLILEYFASSREEQVIAQKNIADRDNSLFQQLKLKCESRSIIQVAGLTVSSVPPEASSISKSSPSLKKFQDPKDICQVQYRNPPPLLQISSNPRLEHTRSEQIPTVHSELERVELDKQILLPSNPLLESSLNSAPDLNHFLSDSRKAERQIPSLYSHTQSLQEKKSYTSESTETIEDMRHKTMSSQIHLDMEYVHTENCDTLSGLTHLSEYVPVLHQRNDLQYENIIISNSIKVEPESEYFDSGDIQLENSMDRTQRAAETIEALDETFLHGILNPEADMEVYRIIRSNHTATSFIDKSTDNTNHYKLESGIDRRQRKRFRSNIAMYECPVCPKCYKTANNLRIHLRGHTGERPYTCPECQISFADPSNLRKHMKKKYHLCFQRKRQRNVNINRESLPVTSGTPVVSITDEQ